MSNRWHVPYRIQTLWRNLGRTGITKAFFFEFIKKKTQEEGVCITPWKRSPNNIQQMAWFL
jgi:hypothetical protein